MNKFNPTRYQGTWYEVGKYPVMYEPMPCSYSVAEYRYNFKGNYLNVLNTCYNRQRQPVISITGIAKPKNDKGQFMISFYPESFAPYPVAPFPVPYDVLWTDYNNLAFVGDSHVENRSFYILARDPSKVDMNFVKKKTAELGYDVSKVIFNYR